MSFIMNMYLCIMVRLIMLALANKVVNLEVKDVALWQKNKTK